jgi:hypothetical protein
MSTAPPPHVNPDNAAALFTRPANPAADEAVFKGTGYLSQDRADEALISRFWIQLMSE